MSLVQKCELIVPDGVDFSITPERLEISYRLPLHTLKAKEVFVLGLCTSLACIILSISLIWASVLWTMVGGIFLFSTFYLISCYSINRWFVSIDSRDVIIDSGPLPIGVDASFDLNSIQYVYTSPLTEKLYRVMARMVDGRAVKLLDSLTEEVACFIQRQIEINLPSSNPKIEKYPS